MFSLRAIGLDLLIADLALATRPDFTEATKKAAVVIKAQSAGRARSPQMARSVKSNVYESNRKSLKVTIGGDGGDLEWAVGAQFGSPHYRQFPAFSRTGYTVGPAVDSMDLGVAEWFADSMLGRFLF